MTPDTRPVYHFARRFGGMLLILAVLGACSTSSKPHVAPTPSLHTITYKVEGTAQQTNITYATAAGTAQAEKVDVPLKQKGAKVEGLPVQMPAGSRLYLSAQNPNNDGATTTCIIEEDGHELVRNTSQGSFTIATCQATAG